MTLFPCLEGVTVSGEDCSTYLDIVGPLSAEVPHAEDPIDAGGVDEAVGLDDAADVGLAGLAVDLALEEVEHSAFVPRLPGLLELPEENS